MWKRMILALGVVAISFGAVHAVESLSAEHEMIRDRVVREYLNSSTEGARVVASPVPIDGDSHFEFRWSQGPVDPPAEAVWFVLLDRTPGVLGWHPVTHLYLDDALEVIEERAATYYPRFYRDGEQIDLVTLVKFRAKPGVVPADREFATSPKRRSTTTDFAYDDFYAVIVEGDIPAGASYSEFWSDPVRMYRMLLEFGYQASNVHVLYGYGNDEADFACEYYREPGMVDFPANQQNVRDLFTWMKDGNAAQGIEQVDDQDFIFLFTFDHGSDMPGDCAASLGLMDGAMPDSEFANYFNQIPYKHRGIMMQQCFSGGFINDLENDTTAISTAANCYESAYQADETDDCGGGVTVLYGEWNYWWMAAMQGKKPWPNFEPVDADANDDGMVSFLEAHNYAVANDDRTEHPQWSDLGGIGDDISLNVNCPDAPTNLVATPVGENRIDLSWLSVPDTAEYRVLRSLSAGGPYEEIGVVTAPATSYSDTPVSGAVTYYYVVRAFENCPSGDSNEASAVAAGACTLAPTFAGLASARNAEENSCGVELTWNAASPLCAGPARYNVYRGDAPSFPLDRAHQLAAGVSGTSFVDKSALTGGDAVYYAVRAADVSNAAEETNELRRSAVPTGPAELGVWSDDGGDTGLATLTLESPWSVADTGGHNAPRVYTTGAYGNRLCSSMTTPSLRVSNGAELRFAAKYDIETAWDAGEVQIATGPDFADWSKLTTVNYPDDLDNTGNECRIPVETGGTVFSLEIAEPSYPASDYVGSLAAFVGQDIKLRFRFSSDGAVTKAGWWIDDIRVTQALIGGACTSEAAVNPKEVSGSGAAPMLVSPSGAELALSFDPACGAIDTALYWGKTSAPLGGLTWQNSVCGLGNLGSARFTPESVAAGELLYFVLVGQSQSEEGSYGRAREPDGTLNERAEAVGVGSCDYPQDLSGSCP